MSVACETAAPVTGVRPAGWHGAWQRVAVLLLTAHDNPDVSKHNSCMLQAVPELSVPAGVPRRVLWPSLHSAV